jgi:uncharacterized membrane protein
MKAAAWANVAAMVTLGVVTARQLGLVKRLPDPPYDVWDSNKIVMSRSAHPAGIPDGVLGMASYAATLALLLLAEDVDWIRPVARAKLAIDAAAAAANAVRQVTLFGRLCSWCMATVACTAAMAALGNGGPAEYPPAKIQRENAVGEIGLHSGREANRRP